MHLLSHLFAVLLLSIITPALAQPLFYTVLTIPISQQDIYPIIQPKQVMNLIEQLAVQLDTLPKTEPGAVQIIADTTISSSPVVTPNPNLAPNTSVVTNASTTPMAQPDKMAGATRPDNSRINQYLNELIDASKTYTTRKSLQRQAGEFFIHNAKVKIFINDTQVEQLPLADLMERYSLMANKIKQINIIENLSKLDPSGRFYLVIAIQETWK